MAPRDTVKRDKVRSGREPARRAERRGRATHQQGPIAILHHHHSEFRRGGQLFWRNTWTSTIAFGIDIVLLWVLVHFAGMTQVLAAAIAFMVGVSIHYVLARKYVYPHTEREVASGYAYFVVNGGIGLLVTIGLYWVLIAILPGWHYLILRGIASVAAGIVTFLLNAVFNFKALGHAKD